MPILQCRQEVGPASQESLWGDAVPVAGVEDQAARRTHMREQTMARQAAERRRVLPAFETRLARPARLEAAREREAELQVELTRINTGHQTWLHEHELTETMETERRLSLPAD